MGNHSSLEYSRNYKATHPEYRAKARIRARVWATNNRERVKESEQARRRANPEKSATIHRRALLKHRYRLTLEQYESMFLDQGGVCAICGRPPKRYRLSVDHCHTTGRVRGLLCPPCNRWLGHIRDNASLARRLAIYLESI